jgi:hypothetical protein
MTNKWFPDTTEQCQKEMAALLRDYRIAIFLTFAWTIFVSVLYRCCLRSRMMGAPGLQAQYFAVIGSIQLAVVLATLVEFLPYCPIVCPDCQLFDRELKEIAAIIPVIFGIVGLCWLRTACIRARVAQQLEQNSIGGGEPMIFSKIPENEVELTEDYSDEEEEKSNDV